MHTSELSPRKKLRLMLDQPGKILLAPGVYDALSALAAYRAGAECAVMGGYAVSGARLAKPDVGLLTMTEMAEQLRIICRAVPLPVIADGDTGHGNELNVQRTVEEFENAGAAAIVLEDQQFPKRCGHMAGKSVIPAEEYVLKLKAALEARSDPDLVIIARCDARAPLGLEEAIRRGHLYLDAGADMLFIEAPQSVAELERIATEFKGARLVANMIEGGKTPLLDTATLAEMGYKLVFWPCTAVHLVLKCLTQAFQQLIKEGTTSSLLDSMYTFTEYNQIMGKQCH